LFDLLGWQLGCNEGQKHCFELNNLKLTFE
jgi:hypothetical protein